MAAALVAEAIHSGSLNVSPDKKQAILREILEREMTHRHVNEVLIRRALIGSYHEEFEFQLSELSDVSGIAAFLFRCPTELKPSINKAMFFIEAEGYVDEEYPDDKASVATLKKSWVKYAIVSPFVFSAIYCEDDLIYSLAPDNPNSIKAAKKYLINNEKLVRFFKLALQVQLKMAGLLDPRTLLWLELTTFPKGIEPATEDVLPFEDHQLVILKKYKAPVPAS